MIIFIQYYTNTLILRLLAEAVSYTYIDKNLKYMFSYLCVYVFFFHLRCIDKQSALSFLNVPSVLSECFNTSRILPSRYQQTYIHRDLTNSRLKQR